MSCPLFIRSVYTLLSSMCTIEGMIAYAKQYGYKTLGLVDKDVLSGAMAFRNACTRNGIKPVYGLQFTYRYDSTFFEGVLYALNDEGFADMMALSSRLCTGEQRFIEAEEVRNYTKNNILCLLSDSMPLSFAVDVGKQEEEVITRQKEIFGDHVVGLIDHDKAQNRLRDEKLRPLLRKHGINTIALSRTFYLSELDNEAYNILRCIRDKKVYADEDITRDRGRYLLRPEEYDELYVREDLLNTDVLASRCNVTMNYQTQLPEYVNRNKIPSAEYLVGLCHEGLRRRLAGKADGEYRKRLDYELSVILKMHFEDYFLIVYDFILHAKKNGIYVGPGRGSAAGSLVSYCLGITDIDPLKYGLIFERFLNPERISMPDIDTDFPDDRRDEVIAYVRERYGLEHVGHIITYGTLKAKQVLRDVGRALGYQPREVDFICKLIPNMTDMSLDKAYASLPLFKQKIESDSRYRRLFQVSRKLEFFPRHESTHAAGIVMSRERLEKIVPLIKVENDIYSTQYTMEHLEQFGLIKMDFLGLRNLSIIAEICDDIGQIDIRSIPLNDAKALKLIADVNVMGIFQLESDGMRNLLRKMRPRSFEEIGMAIALFRPGPMKNIPVFLQNRSHPEHVDYLHPDLKPILSETYGIIVYQEQIINIARKLAGFSYGKADIMRKAMSKKKYEELNSLHDDFISGCLKNGYRQDLAEKIYALIMEFANYGFNKSHSIAYAMVAYQLAYLKANHPLYFYKACLNGVMGSESKTYDYISECLGIGQKIKGISLNDSELTYAIKGDTIVMPFGICKDVGSISAQKIVEERTRNGRFNDFVDAICRLDRCQIDRRVIENLIQAGAFDGLGYGRYTMIKALDNVMMYAQAHRGDISLMDDLDDRPLISEFKDDLMILAENEKNVLGFYFSFNPIAAVRKKYNIVVEDLKTLSFRNGNVAGFGLIKRVKEHRTRKGDMMAFVDLIDDKGALSLAVMPELYSRNADQLVKGKYVSFRGRIEKEASCLVKDMQII